MQFNNTRREERELHHLLEFAAQLSILTLKLYYSLVVVCQTVLPAKACTLFVKCVCFLFKYDEVETKLSPALWLMLF